MGDDLALARVRYTVPGVEQATRDGNERIVKVRLERAISVRVNDLECCGI